MMDHGGNIREAAALFGGKPEEWLDFSANYNILDCRKITREIIERDLDQVFGYPDPSYRDLTSAVSRFYGAAEEGLTFGNGSIELIYSLLHLLKIKKLVVPVPNFSEYRRALPTGAAILPVKWSLEESLQPVIEALKEISEPGFALILSHPNNPSGLLYPGQDMEQLIELTAEKGGWLIVDEAFMEFTPFSDSCSLLDDVSRFSHLIVLRSLTKILSIPGLRLGFCCASENLAGELKSFLPPWNINALAAAVGREIELYREIIEATPGVVKNSRDLFLKDLKRLPMLRIIPSHTNYLLVKREDSEEVADLVNFCADRRVLVRNCGNYQGLGSSWFRVAVKSPGENSKLMAILTDFFNWRSDR